MTVDENGNVSNLICRDIDIMIGVPKRWRDTVLIGLKTFLPFYIGEYPVATDCSATDLLAIQGGPIWPELGGVRTYHHPLLDETVQEGLDRVYLILKHADVLAAYVEQALSEE